jgi:hypothetical protein
MAEGNDANGAVKDSASRKRLTARVARPRKKQKRSDVYDDPDAVLGDDNSPLFKDGVNIKVCYVIRRLPRIIYIKIEHNLASKGPGCTGPSRLGVPEY